MKRAKFGEVIRIVVRRSARRLVGEALALLLFAHNACADTSLPAYGMPTRVAPAPYLRMPHLAGGKIPPLLSQTGAFSDTRRLVPARGLIPYDIVVAFWSDGALKTRWVAVPDEKIKYSPTGDWVFPQGTVFVKTFGADKFFGLGQ